MPESAYRPDLFHPSFRPLLDQVVVALSPFLAPDVLASVRSAVARGAAERVARIRRLDATMCADGRTVRAAGFDTDADDGFGIDDALIEAVRAELGAPPSEPSGS